MPVAAQPDRLSFQIRDLKIRQVPSEPTTLRDKKFADRGTGREVVELATWYDGSFSWTDLKSPKRSRFICLLEGEKWSAGAVDACFLSPDGNQAVFCEDNGSLAVLTRTLSGYVGHGIWLPRIRFSKNPQGVADVPHYCSGLTVWSVAWSRDSDEVAILYEDGMILMVDRRSPHSARIVSKSNWNWTAAQPPSDFVVSQTVAKLMNEDQSLSVATATPRPVHVIAFCTKNYAVLAGATGGIIDSFEARKADVRLRGDWFFPGDQDEFIAVVKEPNSVVLQTIDAVTGRVTGQLAVDQDEFAGTFPIPKEACFVETGVRVLLTDYPDSDLFFLLDWQKQSVVPKPKSLQKSHLLRTHRLGFKGRSDVLLNSTATPLPTVLESTTAWPSKTTQKLVEWDTRIPPRNSQR